MHGYDHPWAGGAGANKWDEQWELGYYNVTTGHYFTRADGICSKHDSPIPVLPSTQYTFVCPYAGIEIVSAILYYDSNDNYISWDSVKTGSTGAYRGFTTPANAAYVRFYLHDSYGITYQNNVAVNYPATAQTYSPYTNICPISGRTETTVTTRNEDNTETASATISFGTTVYGGQVDFKTGNVTVEWGYIASYNGETLPGAWISDRDVYAAGTTPTTDAEVCYELATPTTLSLTPDILTMLKNNNSVSGDGVITITAYTGSSYPVEITRKRKTKKKGGK